MITGWIDLSRGFSQVASLRSAEPPETATRERRISLPGLEVRVTGADVDLAVDRGIAVACTGSPRFGHESARRTAVATGPAAGWLTLLRDQRHGPFSLVSGSYAVVFLDAMSRSAILACDRFAIRPLCYAFEGGRLAFSDRADEVSQSGRREIDLQAIYDYLYFHVIPTPWTVFRGVRRLPPAHAAYVTNGALRVEPHWVPVFQEPRSTNIEDLKREFRALVREAVAREAAERNVGCFLSGGTDSSTVAGMLGEVTGRPSDTYSIGFDAEGYDEMSYARIAARHFGARHHEHYITPDDLVRGIPEVAAHYDQPFGNSSALPAYRCAQIAKADGLDKLLAGDGGDELFGGNTRYATQRVFEAYYYLPAALRSSVVEPIVMRNKWLLAVPLVRKAARYVEQAQVPMPNRMHTYNLLERVGVSKILESTLLSQVDVDEPARQQRATYARVNGSLVNAMLAYDWKYTLADNDLPKVCGTAALAGIGVGFPLLADEIVDFSLRLPTSMKLRGLKLRYFFKEALRGFLPDAIIAKKKHGFGLPFGPWLTRHEGLRGLARASLVSLADRRIVRRHFLDELINRRVLEHPAYFGEMIWILMMLEHWLADKAPRFGLPGPSA